MRIAVLHNFYDTSRPSGENSVVLNDIQELRNLGHEVNLYGFGISDLSSEKNDSLKIFSHILKIVKFRRRVKLSLKGGKPDLIHFHNLFPFVGFGILNFARKLSIPTVYSMHNYRVTCLNGKHFRNDQICTKCLGAAPIKGIFLKCFRGSRVQSLVAFFANYKLRIAVMRARGVVTISPFMTAHIKEFVDRDCIIFERPTPSPRTISVDFLKLRQVVCAGRIAKEKGFYKLCEDWEKSNASTNGWSLLVLGDGPEMQTLVAKYSNNNSIKFMGLLTSEEVSKIMKQSALVVVPSIWYEGFPKIISQASEASCSLAITDIGSLGSIRVPGLTRISLQSDSWVNYFNQLELKPLLFQGNQNFEWWKREANSKKSAAKLADFYRKVIA